MFPGFYIILARAETNQGQMIHSCFACLLTESPNIYVCVCVYKMRKHQKKNTGIV